MNNCLLSMFVSFLSNMGCLWKNFIVSFWASYWLISCFHFTNMSCRGQPRICLVAANTSAKGDHSGHCNISIRLMTLLRIRPSLIYIINAYSSFVLMILRHYNEKLCTCRDFSVVQIIVLTNRHHCGYCIRSSTSNSIKPLLSMWIQR